MKNYLKTALEKLDSNYTITCEDCGKQDTIGHAIIDHDQNTIKVVCNACFLNGYKDLLYSDRKLEN
jgi:transcription elongation factor Elf1